MNKTSRGIATLAIGIALTGSTLSAAPIMFTVDPSQSWISIDVSSSLGPGGASEQSPGSWTTNYSGDIVADVTNSTIQILPATTLIAGISGDFSPAPIYPTTDPPEDRAEDDLGYVNSSAPANYGTSTDLSGDFVMGPAASNSAIRDLQLSLSDDTAKSISVGGTFSEVGIQPTFVSGISWLSYGNASSSGPVSDLTVSTPNLTVETAGDGTLTQSGSLLTMTLPIEFTAPGFFTSTTYYGTIVATANVPEPTTIALLLPAASMLWAGARRTRIARTL